MVAAHLSMSRTQRLDIWVTPTQGNTRKLVESDPLYRYAVREIQNSGGLRAGQRALWKDEAGNAFLGRLA
jgi:hypothetical protein